MTPVRRNILLAAVAAAALSVSPALSATQAVKATHKTTQRDAATMSAEAPVPAADLATPKYGTWGFDTSGMDTSIKPGDDFFGYANGKWAARTEIPSDRVRFGNFDKLTVLSEHRAHAIDMEAAAGRLSDKDAAKIGAAYASFMNEALADRLGAKPIAAGAGPDPRGQDQGPVHRPDGQGQLHRLRHHLPGGHHHRRQEPEAIRRATRPTAASACPTATTTCRPPSPTKKAKYLAYVQQMLTLAGWPKPAENAKAVVDFESQLAEASWTRIERRDRDKTYNPATPAEMDALAPGIGWARYLAAADLPGVTRVVVTTNTAFPKVAKIYADTPLDTLKAWQAFHVADGAAPYLSKAFVDAHYAVPQQGAGRPAGAAAALEARGGLHQRGGRRVRRAGSMWPATSRRQPRPRWTPWWATSTPRCTPASRSCPG